MIKMRLVASILSIGLLAASAVLLATSSWAETTPTPAAAGAKTASENAAELSDPNSTLGLLNFNFDYVSYAGDLPGAGDQSAFRMIFQPVLPYPVAKGVNFFFRPSIPVVFKQDVPVAGGFENPGFGLADAGFDAALGKSFASGVVLVGGVAGTLPTATDDYLGKDQWSLGPGSQPLSSRNGACWGCWFPISGTSRAMTT